MKTTRLIIALAALVLTSFGEPLDPSALGQIAIQHTGRIKPLQTFAQATLLQLNARSSHRLVAEDGGGDGKLDATEWLAQVLFEPERTFSYKTFRINNPLTADALGIEREEKFRYSFAELRDVFETLESLAQKASRLESDERDPVDTELIRVYNNVRTYLHLTDALSFLAPSPRFSVPAPEIAAELGLAPGRSEYSFYEVLATGPKLASGLRSVDLAVPATWSEEEASLFALARSLHEANRMLSTTAGILHIIPVPGEPWRPPHAEFFAGEERPVLTGLALIREAYLRRDQAAFDSGVASLNAVLSSQLPPDDEQARYLQSVPVEQIYNQLDPFYSAKFLYLFSLLALATGALFLRRPCYWLSALLLVTGGVLQIVGIGMRMYITSRPPITNLYETFIFVGAIGFLMGLLLELIQRKGMGLLVGGISALIMLAVSGKFGQDGDTMEVLQAVLDSNFWLATHVVTINLGYAGCCVAGVIGHIYLVQRLRYALRRNASRPQPTDDERKGLTETYAMVFGVLAFGLIFTFVGTVLGGIWADQSWGRFWGWDPKENGALLIVLWCAALIHARLGKMIGQVGMAAGAVLGIVVVMMAWFGINLLGVGLHSYGFTSGVARNLVAYCAIEALFLLAVVPLVWHLEWRAARWIKSQADAADTKRTAKAQA